MTKINPLNLFSWTLRHNEKDVIDIYDSLSDLMRLATAGNMLNFGYWESDTPTPVEAQQRLCGIFAKKAKLEPCLKVVDVGSGYGSPALQWCHDYSPLEMKCVNINFEQVKSSMNLKNELNENQKSGSSGTNIDFVNSTARLLPFKDDSMERVLALESSHHFKPLKNFFAESFRILKKNGIMCIALPVLHKKSIISNFKLGILSMTWTSAHYSIDFVKSNMKQEGFSILESQEIGSKVFEPLANYYMNHRDILKQKILKEYPSYLEGILCKSLNKMKEASQKKIIDYIIITCKK